MSTTEPGPTAAAPTSLLTARRSGPLRGTCRVPGDKSISHRALLFGALCDGVVEVRGLGEGGDNKSTARALEALGVDIRIAGTDARVGGVGIAGRRLAEPLRRMGARIEGRADEARPGEAFPPLRVQGPAGGALRGASHDLPVA